MSPGKDSPAKFSQVGTLRRSYLHFTPSATWGFSKRSVKKRPTRKRTSGLYSRQNPHANSRWGSKRMRPVRNRRYRTGGGRRGNPLRPGGVTSECMRIRTRIAPARAGGAQARRGGNRATVIPQERRRARAARSPPPVVSHTDKIQRATGRQTRIFPAGRCAEFPNLIRRVRRRTFLLRPDNNCVRPVK